MLSLKEPVFFFCTTSQFNIALILSKTNPECLSPIYPKQSATHYLIINSGSVIGIFKLIVWFVYSGWQILNNLSKLNFIVSWFFKKLISTACIFMIGSFSAGEFKYVLI